MKIIVNFQSRIESLITHLVIWTLKIQYEEQSRTRVVTVYNILAIKSKYISYDSTKLENLSPMCTDERGFYITVIFSKLFI